MRIRLTQSYINSTKMPDKSYWITDTGCQNLRLYVGTRSKVWYVGYREEKGNYVNHKLGPAGDAITVAQARDMANDFMVRLAKGENPQKKPVGKIILGDYLTSVYEPWVVANRRSGQLTVNALRSSFKSFLKTPIDELRMMDIEKWRMEKLASGLKAASCNRRLTALKAAINWGVKREILESNPLQKLEPLQEHDSDVKVRYLSDDERKRLMEALDERERRIRDDRESHNEWLAERGHKLMPALSGEFADHMKPMILFSLHTGIRRGNLFSLKWSDIDFHSRTLMLRAAVTKHGKTLQLPINSVAFAVLTAWRDQSENTAANALVFPSPVSGGTLDNVKKAWSGILKMAEIENFRWHDMRHDFASRLVMQGVDLNVVRELLGHADMKMTMRYAHLAPSIKLQAVELLTR